MGQAANTWLRICYTLWSPVYNWLSWPFARRRRRSLELAALRPGERVVIVGAGTGQDLDFMPPGLSITAIDLTPAMIRRLRRRAQRLGLEVDTQVMDAQALALPDGAFEVAVLHLILAVVPGPACVLREAARVLRPGGRAVVFDKFLADGRPPPLWVRGLDVLASLVGTRLARQFAPILAGSGLQVVHDEPAGLRGCFRIILLRKGS